VDKRLSESAMAYRFHSTNELGVDVCKVYSLIQKIILDTNTATLNHPPALHMTVWNLAEEIVKCIHKDGMCPPKFYALCRTYELEFSVVKLAPDIDGAIEETHEILFAYSSDKDKGRGHDEYAHATSSQPKSKRARLE